MRLRQKTVTVAVEIESCQECPHYYPSWGEFNSWCLEEERKTEPYDIPDWCPFVKLGFGSEQFYDKP